ncbi:DUF6542 domain-containing protein [Spirillospora sp. NPDC047279]|uniref:DUF6542 domain-containing protein n=1 Tax=Spirillospora sp. NPDC047279 TaxID=3155478 RepID=UPI0033E5A432
MSSSVSDAPGGASPAPGGPVRRDGGAPGPRLRSAAAGNGPIALTGRGGIVVIFGVGLLGALFSRGLETPMLAGLAFAAGCALAAFATRPADLLTLAVSPPLVFLAVTLVAEIMTSLGEDSLFRGIAVGMITALASTAPWLFLGTILVIGIGAPRGLVTAYRELRDKLVGSRLFEEEENENPVRWDETPAAGARTERSRHARREPRAPRSEVD